MSVTIKDIARVAGVSYSTVSKALNDSPLVQRDTKEKIIQVAKQLGYQPNMVAKSLVSKKSHIIGIVWPTVERLAWSTLVTKINDLLGKHSYQALLSINPVESAVMTFNRFQVDGILLFREDGLKGKKSDPLSSTVPILYYGKSGATHYPTIDINRRKAIYKAIRYLACMGHQRIAYIGEVSPNDTTQQDKYMGYTDGIIEFGLPTHPEMVIKTKGNSPDEGYLAIKSLIHSSFRPTAVISGSYDLTVGIMRAAKEEGIKIPEELSIVSYDNIPEMSKFDVPITAVGAPVEQMAEHIVEALLKLVKDKEEIPFFTEIDIELVERNSCFPLMNLK